MENVVWGDIDVLLIDTPPGTSDEHITVAQNISNQKFDGAVLVTTPQNVSVGDVRREITFCRKVGIDILGIVENMSGFVCPHCSDCTNIFSSGGGTELAKEQDIPFLGMIPIDPILLETAEKESSFENKYPSSPSLNTIKSFVENFLKNAENNKK
eukprot:TRINITY_DN3157_c0_g1_i1.p1 TRINITY_DN3157_c0_g1~~TRINITY_DN3157_c0_g1_i1.p1  ORF type:complete len:155 (-),score=49.86 TRINITY_DN3157_c0_g1_i1:8-472(-)